MNTYRTTIVTLMLATALFAITACAGGRANMKFADLQYPASLSAYLYGPNNELLAKGKELDVVSKFRFEKRYWGILYSAVSFGSDKDVTQEMNRQIEKSKADGIVNVRVTTENSLINKPCILSLIPLWPGRANVLIEGDIVKMKK